jgi:nitroimidazol reductase NimA-like FMN-containing flavoprotein (pyridoxamine 5'-phosphate oxidase superfamily)
VSLAMTKQERETFLADLHVGIISIPEEGRGPLTVPIWYSYEPGGELRVVTARTSRKAQLLRHAGRFSVCVQTETWPYKYVSVEGPVVAIEPADVDRDRRPLAHRYFGAQRVTDTSRRHG